MKLKLNGLLLAVASALSFVAWAEPATDSDAGLAARGWLASNGVFGSFGEVLSVTPEKNGTNILWYVVRTAKGALVVSSDTEIEPVVAAIPNGDGQIPSGSPLRAMLTRDLGARLTKVRSAPTKSPRVKLAPVGAAAKWALLKDQATAEPRASVKMLGGDGNPATIVKWLDGWNSDKTETAGGRRVQTLRFWNQSDSERYFTNEQVFNVYTPSNYPCGCVATAGSSVMHYFRVTADESRPVMRPCSVNGETEFLETRGGPYDWSLIDDLDLSPENPVELPFAVVDLLGRVASDCGIGCEMSYSARGSGSYSTRLASSFRDVFGIPNAQLVTVNGSNYGLGTDIGEANYEKIIYNQIRAGAPVVLGIDGHEVVACGYGLDAGETAYTYVFLGWGGINDAWYALPEIDTKATEEGGWYVSTFVDELITEIAPDDAFIPVVGRVVDKETGTPLANYAGLTLSDGTPVVVDENGYWGVRVAASDAREIVDGLGTGHAYVVGERGETTSSAPVAAATLSEALPDELTIAIDAEATGYLRLYQSAENARRQAWNEGKLLYVVAGTDDAAVEARLQELRNTADSFKDGFVFVRVSPAAAPLLVTEAVQDGAFDPRVFNVAGEWTADNGLWSDPATWGETPRQPTEVTVRGACFVSSIVAYNSYEYDATVTYADGLVAAAIPTLVTWSLSDDTLAVYRSGVLRPRVKAEGEVVLTATCEPFAGEAPCEGDVTIRVSSQPVSTSPVSAPGYAIADASAPEAFENAYPLAKAGLVAPSVTVPLSGRPGGTVMARAKELVTLQGQYVFRCTGYELYKDGELTESGTFDENSPDRSTSGAKEVGFPITFDTMDVEVKWVWQVEKSWIQTDAVNCVIDQGPQFVMADESLLITALPPGGCDPETTMIVWQGCLAGEVVSSTQALVRADAPRLIVANGVGIGEAFDSKVPAAGCQVGPGYHVETVEEREDGTVVLMVVEGDPPAPDPKYAEPEPIAFSSVKMNDDRTEVTLTFTNAVQWCNYAVFGAPTLAGGIPTEGVEPVTNFQWTVSEPTVKLTLPTNGNLFWRVTAEKGLIP